MKRIMYSCLDHKAGVFMTPYFAVNDATGVRAFGMALEDKGTPCGHFPEDFSLYRLGYFDDGDGVISLPTLGQPELVVSGLALSASLKVKEA